ncbi:MAG: class I SAM-dependent methyltransferase [Pseudomonadota bacterium]
MTDMQALALAAAKQRMWFYEFELPDGTLTQSFLPPHLRPIHTSRRDKLRQVVTSCLPGSRDLTAIDLACHEGYFSVALARYFRHVRAYDLREENVRAARLMISALGIENVEVDKADVRTLAFREDLRADFVLIYGLLYHVEDPIGLLRLASNLARRQVLIETQVLPFDISGRVEDGNYQSQRDFLGVFGLAADNAESREGGATSMALVPSVNTLRVVLKNLGFRTVTLIEAPDGDFEQFRRGSRVVIHAEK